jgi:signal transduction histidine kinase
MDDRWDDRADRRERVRHSRRAQREAERAARAQEREGGRAKPERTPEEEAYREARLAANRRLGFVFHFIPYVATCLFLLVVTRSFTATFSVATFWGIGVFCHWFAAVHAPALRKRWIDQEVDHQVGRTVTRERRALEGAHARSLEELSASIAHEIRNPITAAKSLVQQMGEDPSSKENVEYARVALTELDRVERSISHLLRFAREEPLRVSEVRLPDLLDAALDTFRERIARRGVRVSRAFDGSGALRGDAEKLRRVAINLIGNALDAMEQAETRAPRLELAAGENLAGSEVWATIRDNGPGVAAEARERIFRPFYTEKANGTGLGLAITRKLVEAHGGSIELHTAPGEGTEFVLTFPKDGPDDGVRERGAGGLSASGVGGRS